MNAIELLKGQIQMANQFLDGTVADVSEEQAHAVPGGTAHPIGASMVHIALAQDVVLNMMVRGSQPLIMTEWAGKAGISEPEACHAPHRWPRKLALGKRRAGGQIVPDAGAGHTIAE